MKAEKNSVPFRTILKTAGWITLVAFFFVILGAAISESHVKEFNKLYIKIDHDKGLFFVDEDDIKRSVQGYAIADSNGFQLRDIDFTEIEEGLEKNPFIEKAEVYSSTKGTVDIDIKQREPLFRIVNNSGVSYYFDANGVRIPTSSKFTARVVVVTGNDENISDSAVFGQLMKLCSFISKDEFWKAQFEQIYVTTEGEFELVPKLANHIILLGKADNLENSFHKLMIFYNDVLKNFDADNYRIINLKYKDQIVCTKNSI